MILKLYEFFLLLIAGIMIGGFIIDPVFAEDYHHVGITFSDTCHALISINDTQTCSTPDRLTQLYTFTDVSNNFKHLEPSQQTSELSYYQSNNAILNHKTECIRKDYCNIFQINSNQTTLLWLEPDKKMIDHLDQHIIIETRLLKDNINTELDRSEIRDRDKEIRSLLTEQSEKLDRVNELDILMDNEISTNNATTEKYQDYRTEKYEILDDIKKLVIEMNELETDIDPISTTNGTRTISFNTHKLFIDNHCRKAILTPEVIEFELGKVLHYLHGDCDNRKLLGHLAEDYTEEIDHHEIDITSSPNWNSQRYWEQKAEECKIKC